MDTLHPCSDDDINNDVSSVSCRNNGQESIVLEMHDLWPKVVEETKTRNGKISAQPHTIVKQICFAQWQSIVFVIVFSIQELNA